VIEDGMEDEKSFPCYVSADAMHFTALVSGYKEQYSLMDGT
jgi:hypothetical protein